MSVTLLLGDCREQLKTLADSSIDSIVTDPPYELGFMGKAWDGTGIAYDVSMWKECLRVLKPGGHLLSFGGTRTYHRMACAIEEAGFEIRDQMQWLYGSGFPKSLNVSKAIDKATGAEREIIGGSTRHGGGSSDIFEERGSAPITAPATDAAKQWDGWGTALKPANEPICVARKPFVETVAQNIQEHGTGAINIDGCRIETSQVREKDSIRAASQGFGTFEEKGGGRRSTGSGANHTAGRWPSNVLLDEEAAAILDEQSGLAKPRSERIGTKGGNAGSLGAFAGSTAAAIGRPPADSGGGASRFFYVAKASRKERNEGLDDFPKKEAANRNAFVGEPDKRMDHEQARLPSSNHHPTVKPVALIRYLVRLVTPPKGIVLDPFLGSGTTGIAAVREGFSFVGIERDPEYIDIARARIEHASKNPAPKDLFSDDELKGAA